MENLPLFKTFKASNLAVSIDISKDTFLLGETVAGNVLVTSDEELEAKEVRVES